MSIEPTDYDGAWKEALERYFRPFLELCFPAVAAGIDWSVPVEFLDQELQEIVRDADLGKQRVDKLVKVQRHDGVEEWVLIHVEVQGRRDPDLPRRMYQYHHRIADRYGYRVVTLAVLADAQPEWQPEPYIEELWGCRVRFEYPACKLMDLARDPKALEEDDNPAAVVIAAHLAAQRTAGNMDARHRMKWALTRRLHERGYDKQDILELFRLIDWLLVLPEGLEIAFRQELIQFETENIMPYVTSIERLARQEGRQEGWQEGRQEGWQEGRQQEAANLIIRLARKRLAGFEPHDDTAIRQLPLADLESLSEALLDFSTVEQLRQWLEHARRP